MSVLAEALHVVELGLAVFPLAKRSKVPLAGSRGVHDATRDEERVRHAIGDGNYGIACGPVSDVLVLDVDPRNGGSVSGWALPDTWSVETGRRDGGEHLYFRWPAALAPGARLAARLANGIDVKGPGGYVLGPGSVHPDTGLEYRWRRAPDDVALAELPQEVLAAIMLPMQHVPRETTMGERLLEVRPGERDELIKRARAYVAQMPPSVATENGHGKCWAVARKLHDFGAIGLAKEDAWPILCEYSARCSPPWSLRELKHKLDSAWDDARIVNPPDTRTRQESVLTMSIGDGVANGARPAGLRDEVAAAKVPLTASLLYGAAIALPLPPLEYLVREIGLVAGGGAPHLVAGYGFTGKTLAMQAMLLSLAAGRGVWGGYSGRRSKVTHVDLEQGCRLDCRRYQRLAFGMGIKLEELGDGLALLAMPRLTLRPEYRSAWLELMTGRDVILVDSLRAATGGLDENSSEIREPLDMLGSISDETSCRPIVVHHARKPSDDKPAGKYSIRGSGALYDASDCVYIFGAEKGEPVAVQHEKARTDGETRPDFALTITDLGDETIGDTRAGLAVQVHGAELVTERKEAAARRAREIGAHKDAETIRSLVGSSPGIGTVELREHSGFTGRRLADAKRALGAALECRDVKVQRGWKTAHYLRIEGPQS